MTWVHNAFFHVWHFLFGQVQLTNWFGNIVAGVVTFLVVGMFWPPARRAVRNFFGRYFSAVHTKIDAQHAERMEQAKRHHREAIALAKKHHEAHMAALAPKPVAKPKPVSPAPAKRVTAPRTPK